MIGNKSTIVILFFVFTTVFSQSVYSSDIEVTSLVDPTTVPIGDRITVTVTISGVEAHKAGYPILEPHQEFDILGPPSTSEEISIINWKTTVQKTYTWALAPKKVGTFDVGAVKVTLGKQVFRAPATQINVTDGQTQTTQPGSTQYREPLRDKKSGDDDTFIKTSVDKRVVYLGEQVTLTFEFFNRRSLIGDSPEYTPPSVTGFWKVDLPDIAPTTKAVNSNIYQYHTKKTALFPTAPGKLTIGPASLTYTYGGFFMPEERRTIQSAPITIQVKPLPENGKPANFSGAVGRFTINATADKTTVKVGDVVSVKVSIVGKGNLNLITSPSTPNFSAFKTYEPKVSETVSNSGFIVSGAKTWEYVIMPKYAGAITIGQFSFSYFDQFEKTYHTVSTNNINLTVLPGEDNGLVQQTGSSSQEAVTIATDIHYIKPNKTSLRSSSHHLYLNPYFYTFYLVPLMVFTSALIVKRRQTHIERDSSLKRKLYAYKNAQKTLSKAVKLLKKEEDSLFYGKVSETLISFIGDKMNVETGTLTSQTIEQLLNQYGVSEDLTGRVRKMLELCDFVRFSSQEYGHKTQENLLKDTRAIINELNEVL